MSATSLQLARSTFFICSTVNIRWPVFCDLYLRPANFFTIAKPFHDHRNIPQVAQARDMSIGEHRHCCVIFEM